MRYVPALLVFCGIAVLLPAPAAAQDALDLESLLQDEQQPIETVIDEAGPGDNKSFRVVTDDDITSLETGDIYKSGKSVFKVTAINSKGSDGGKFTVERIGGTDDPQRTWNRTSGLGPLTIVSRETLWDLYLAGGNIMHAIAFCMVITIVIGLNSLWVFRRSRQCAPAFVEPARNSLRRNDIADFQDLAMQERGLFGHICRAMAVRYDTSTMEDVNRRCEIEAGRQIRRLRAPLQGLSLMAAVAPLLGLLGTVVGIVTCFESVAFEAASVSKTQTLAGGIRVALFTTLGGLTVAIPALFILYASNLRLGSVVSECESLTEQFLHEIAQNKRQHPSDANRPPADAEPVDES